MTNIWYSLRVACLLNLFRFVFCGPNSVSTELSLSHQEAIKGNIFVCGLNEKAKEIFSTGRDDS